MSFVPDGFDVPDGLATDAFRLEPLDTRHNESDHAAWTSSVEHIRATPGFERHPWPPDAMTPEQNRSDLEAHARDFAARTGFAYTVLAPGGEEVIGCVYIYPRREAAEVRSWVRASDADLDAPLHAAVSRWLDERWPFERVDYAPRSSR